jgi:hypothetical protein
MCDLYDAGQLLRLELDAERLSRRYDNLFRKHAAPPVSVMQESIVAKRPILRRVDFSSRREFLMLPSSFDWKNYVDKTMAEASAVLQQI